MSRAKTDFNLDLGSMAAESADPMLPTLTMAEMQEIQAQAQAEVAAELKASLRKDFLARTKADLKKQMLFKAGTDEKGEVLERILIDLPKFAADIRLDGVIYSHRHSYVFGQAKAAVIKEQMNRLWLHHAEINGLDINEYNGRKKANERINPQSVGMH